MHDDIERMTPEEAREDLVRLLKKELKNPRREHCRGCALVLRAQGVENIKRALMCVCQDCPGLLPWGDLAHAQASGLSAPPADLIEQALAGGTIATASGGTIPPLKGWENAICLSGLLHEGESEHPRAILAKLGWK